MRMWDIKNLWWKNVCFLKLRIKKNFVIFFNGVLGRKNYEVAVIRFYENIAYIRSDLKRLNTHQTYSYLKRKMNTLNNVIHDHLVYMKHIWRKSTRNNRNQISVVNVYGSFTLELIWSINICRIQIMLD